jgi:signal transduction histidine kinase
MLTRIEHDRKSLETTVAELGAANRKLKMHQQEMIRTEKLASVGRMAAGLAHEIGNPLGIVQGYLGLLGRSGAYNEEHRDYISRADQELQRVNALIRQMLNFARVSKGEPGYFSIHELLRSVVDMVQVQPVFNTIQLTCRLEADRDTVYADQEQLRQVFVNCLLNSADAVIAAGWEKDSVVTVSTDNPESQSEDEQIEFVRIRISDNGIGIAGEQLALIFDPFYTTKEPGKGTGLGLSVSLSIIESTGGRIEMDSKEGQGSVLSIFLPVPSVTERE